MSTRLPLQLALRRAVEWPLERWRSLLPATLLLALVDAACFAGMLAAANIDSAGVPQPQADAAPLLLLAMLVAAAIGLSYGLGVYRRVLLDEPRPGLSLFVLDRRLLRALGLGARIAGMGIVLIVLASLLARFVGGGASLPTIAMLAYLVLVLPRLRFAFAAAAMDEPVPTLAEAWRRTRSEAVGIVAGVVMVYVALTIAQSLLGLIPGLDEGVPAFLLAGLFAALQSCVSVVFIALAYDALVRGGGPGHDATSH
jgi:hypothetical protein